MAKIGSQTWLAERIGISQARVSQLVRDGRIPRRTLYTRQDVEDAKQMLAEARTTAHATMSTAEEVVGDREVNDPQEALRQLIRNPEKAARVKLLIARTSQIDLRNKVESGGLILKSEVERQQVQKIHAVRAKMAEIPLRSSLIAHKTEAEAEVILESWMREICDFFAGEA
jgi:hypothetical protein